VPQVAAELVKRGFAPPGAGGDDPLEPLVDAAVEYVELVTGNEPIETVPADRERTALRAVALRTLQEAYQDDPEYVETVNDDLIQSFSAGSYSETRHEQARGSRYQSQGQVWASLNPWPALAMLLWLLMTEDAKERWREDSAGQVTPAFAVTETDWAAVSWGEGGWAPDPVEGPRRLGWPGPEGY
jgi:hypothetical protein